jgi:hypothetical protein
MTGLRRRKNSKSLFSLFPPVQYFSLDKLCSIHLNQLRIMKTQQSQLNVILIFAAAVTALCVAGCAGVGSGNTTSLLTAAGFRARTPQTPKQQQIYAALPPYQVQHATVPGKGVFYVYKDEKAGIAYVGREAEYQRYKELAVQQQIAQNYYMAAEMDRAAAFGWYGAWGPRAFWW